MLVSHLVKYSPWTNLSQVKNRLSKFNARGHLIYQYSFLDLPQSVDLFFLRHFATAMASFVTLLLRYIKRDMILDGQFTSLSALKHV